MRYRLVGRLFTFTGPRRCFVSWSHSILYCPPAVILARFVPLLVVGYVVVILVKLNMSHYYD